MKPSLPHYLARLFRRGPKRANLVLGGGGIKGIGLVGAIAAMQDNGYHFDVVAGCSAGSIVAALVASGMPVSRMRQLLAELDIAQFQDSPFTERMGLAAKGISVVARTAIHSGDNLHAWITRLLAERGVHTFADLKFDDPKLPPERRYRLVVAVADVTHGRLLWLPWDYHKLGLNPDTQSVADAIRASNALPLFYRPYKLGNATLMDGGIVTNFPVGIFRELQRYHKPTFGVRLSFTPEVQELGEDIKGIADLAKAMIITTINAQGEEMMRDPEIGNNTIVVDVDDVKITDFNIDKAKQEKLYHNGYAATQAFLQRRT